MCNCSGLADLRKRMRLRRQHIPSNLQDPCQMASQAPRWCLSNGTILGCHEERMCTACQMSCAHVGMRGVLGQHTAIHGRPQEWRQASVPSKWMSTLCTDIDSVEPSIGGLWYGSKMSFFCAVEHHPGIHDKLTLDVFGYCRFLV